MSGFELVAGIIGIFFGAGVVVGGLLVIALPLFQRGRRGGVRYMNGAGWQDPPARRDDDHMPPRWPGL
jgi:hypothetical protein